MAERVFKVGDAVRVKAGNWDDCPTVGRKLIVQRTEGGLARLENCLAADVENLEPWNDAEHWDGSKWVAKKPEPKFKKGDRVKIVGPSVTGRISHSGIIATVTEPVSPVREGVQVKEDDSDQPFGTYPESSLMLVPAIVCLREDGFLKPGTAMVHGSTIAEFADAQKKAEANPGKEYVVLQEKGSKRVEPKPSAAEAVALAISNEIKDKHMSTWKFRDGTSFGVVPVRMNWDYESDEVTIRFRCHRPA